MRRIYLDYNATTPIAPSVQEAMLPFLVEQYGNPSSSHALGRACYESLEDARDRVAALIGADREEIVFTSGGTESNNLALLGIMLARVPNLDGHLVISAIEHPSVAEPARFLERLGFRVTTVVCNRDGVVEADAISAALRPDTRLVSVMHANNEIGTLQPIREIAELCQARDVLLHTDAAQSVGKIRVSVDDMRVDLLSIAGHKLYAPKGIGALFVRHGVPLKPFMFGAGHESGLRPGTENTPYIVALGQACLLAGKAIDDAGDRMLVLRDRLLNRLRAGVGNGLHVHGEEVDRLPNTLSVSFPEVNAAELLARTPELCASTGAACHSGKAKLPVTLAAMKVDPKVARGTVRLSLGWYTSEDDVDRAAEWLLGAWESLK